MTERKPAKTALAWRPIVAAFLLAGGIGFVVMSFVWPRVADVQANWSTDQARKYQAASMRLHSLSHQFAKQSRQGLDHHMRAELEAAKSEFDSLSGQLDAARDRPANVAFVLRLIGVALMAAGGLGLYRSQAVA